MELSKRTFGLIIAITLALLFYVHQQISIFRVSYTIQKQETEVTRLSEAYKLVKFRVARLYSPHVLSQRMKQLSLDLTTPTEQEIIRVLKPKMVPQESKITWPDPVQFLSWLHFIKEAQAKTAPKE